ncbi:MAG TPA: recombinase family protein [Kofleriaceae bacterium]|nr:recombinase family protein [Kofleriaceae bacterium]
MRPAPIRRPARAVKSTSSPSPAQKRCAIYTRKSTGAGLDKDFSSLDAQREVCAEYIRRQPDWVLLDRCYDDGGYTGANIERPAFQRLLADVDAGQIDIIVVYKLDRLSRSLIDFAQMMARFSAAGVSFIAVTQNFSTSDPTGRLTVHFLMAFAEFEREMIAERTRDKIAGARRRGKWTGGQVPLGYEVADGRLMVNEAEAAVVREIFALYLEHRAILEVVRVLNERNRETKQHRAANGRTRAGHAWTKPDVQRVLHNPLYAGYVRAGGELCDGEHRALVSRDVFSRTAAALAAAAPAPRGAPPNHEYILRGLLRCGCCGASFTTASTCNRPGVTYRYYRCLTRDKQGSRACHSKPLPAAAIEAYVVDRLRKVIGEADGAFVTTVTTAVQTRLRDREAEVRAECSLASRQIAALRAEMQQPGDARTVTDATTKRPSRERLDALVAERGQLEDQLSAAEDELSRLEALESEGSWIGHCLRDFDGIWDVLTPANRARLVRAVVEHIKVDEPAGKITVTLADLSTRLSAMNALAESAGGEHLGGARE